MEYIICDWCGDERIESNTIEGVCRDCEYEYGCHNQRDWEEMEYED